MRNNQPAEAAELLEFLRRLRIAHHIPGRIRLKLEANLTAPPEELAGKARNFTAGLGQIPGIRAINLNFLARSCTVEYDPNELAPTGWHNLIDGVDSPDSASLFAILLTKYRELSRS